MGISKYINQIQSKYKQDNDHLPLMAIFVLTFEQYHPPTANNMPGCLYFLHTAATQWQYSLTSAF